MKRLIAPALLVSLAAAGGGALAGVPGIENDNPILAARWGLNVGGYLVDFDTSAAVGVAAVLGTVVDIESTLGLDDSQTVFRLEGFYRFNRKHALEVSYLGFRRDAAVGIAEEIDYAGITFLGTVSSKFDMDSLRLSYRYSFHNDGRVNAGLLAGLATFDFDTALSGDAVIIDNLGVVTPIGTESAEETIAVPIPNVGLFVEYAIRRWAILRMSAESFRLDAGDFDARYLETKVLVDFFFSEHVGLGVGLQNTELRYADTGEDPTLVDYRYSGFVANVSLSF